MTKLIHRPILALLLVLTSLSLFAQVPNGYYNTADGKTGNDLKVALHNIIKGHKSLSYNGLLDAYAYTDCKSNGKIWDMYSNYEFSLSNSCGSYKKEGDCYNREHTWPQSWFNDQTTPRCDLFHVVPTDGYVNGMRGNFPYGEVSNPNYTSGNGSKRGPCTTPGYTGIVFEPIDEYKGDIARGLFYVSVRYMNEDSGWSSSPMTSKSEILPWAMTMLLRWSDEDPVSQKEIDRNNAVYGFQENRNPFIDNPEYAHMIWDDNYQGTTYDITCTQASHGTISASPTTANAGQSVTLSATPDQGYVLDHWTVTDAGNHNISVTNNQFVMPAANVNVTAVFSINNTHYTVSLNQPTHGTISANPTSALSGQTVTLNVTPESGYALREWYVNENTSGIRIPVTNNQFVMPAANVTVTCTFSTDNSSAIFEKVTTTPSNWSGDYLIVYETGHMAFNGALTTLDAANNTISVDISNNTIESNATTNGAIFTIVDNNGTCTIRSASGYYIGATSNSNSLVSNTNETYPNSISLDASKSAVIAAVINNTNGPTIRFNNASNQNRFRYYKSGQQAVQLYRLVGEAGQTPTHTIRFHGNGGTSSAGDPYTQVVDEGVPTALNPSSFTRNNFRFDGWNDQANGTGTYYVDGSTVTLYDDLDLYAMWDILYPITCASTQHGTISADKTSAVEDETVTLSAQPASGYMLDSWTVTDANNNDIPIYDNQFTMPASAVTVTASFIAGSAPTYAYVKVTTAPADWTGNYLIVCEEGNIAFDGSRATLDATNNYVNVTIADNTIEYNNEISLSSFNIAKKGDKYTVQSASGYYIGVTGTSNMLSSSTSTEYTNTLSITSDYDANITSEKGTNLRCYLSNKRFRYTSSDWTKIQLYRKMDSEPSQTSHTITLATVQHGSIHADKSYAATGELVTLTATPDAGYALSQWNVTTTNGLPVTVTNNTFTMPDANVNVSASFEEDLATYAYIKVTEAPEDWTGNYLIVYETKALDGSKTIDSIDKANNFQTVTINGDRIDFNENTQSLSFDIQKVNSKYSIKSFAHGYYIGNTSDHTNIDTNTEPSMTQSISFGSTDTVFIAGHSGRSLKYNAGSSNPYFRYYRKGKDYKSVKLYRKTEIVPAVPVTITFNGNGGSCSDGTSYTQTVQEDTPAYLTPNRFQREGFLFNGWNTAANGSGTAYADCAAVSLSQDLTLYAQWQVVTEMHYARVTEEPTDWSGNYLIVYEADGVAFNGALTSLDVNNNEIPVTIINGTIDYNSTHASSFTITKNGSKYAIQAASGQYLNSKSSSDNGISTSSTPQYVHAFTFYADSVLIATDHGNYLRYNNSYNTQTSTQYHWFRYYKGSTYTLQRPVTLYRRTEGAGPQPTAHSITLAAVQNGSISADKSEAVAGTTITLTATPNTGYYFTQWTVTDSNGQPVTVTNNHFTMPDADVTVSATFEQGYVTYCYVKVTSAPEDWTGQYLIVYESDTLNVAFDGSLEVLEANFNNIPVNILGDVIQADVVTNASCFQITKGNGKYAIQSASGKYIGPKKADGTELVTYDTAAYIHTLNLSSGSAVIQSDKGSVLRFNANNTAKRFRYYNNSQQKVQLYRYEQTTIPMPITVKFHGNGGSSPQGNVYTQLVEADTPTALNENRFTKTGFQFSHWNTKANGTGEDYQDEQTVTLSSNLDLYAQWQEMHSITLATVQHGSIEADKTYAMPGETITLIAHGEEGYVLEQWTVTDSNGQPVTVTNNHFTMPDADVTVSATFMEGIMVQQYVKVTEEPADWTGNYLIVFQNNTMSVAFNGALDVLNVAGNHIPVEITDDIIYSSETLQASSFNIAKSGNKYTVQSASGWYIGTTGTSTGLASNKTTQYLNLISLDEDANANVISEKGPYLRFNISANLFRYYQASTYTSQQPIQLYRYEEGIAHLPHTVTFYGNGGSYNNSSSYTQIIPDNKATDLMANKFTCNGHQFTGWNTAADGTGTSYADGQTVTLTADLSLYAQWQAVHTITLATVQHGSISANVSQATAGEVITLSATPSTGYILEQWTVTDSHSNAVEVSNNQFVMPDDNVTVSATFIQGSVMLQYVLVTEEPLDWTGNYLIVNGSKAMDGRLESTDIDDTGNVMNVVIDENAIDVVDSTLNASFDIAKVDGRYTIQSHSQGYYIGNTKDKANIETSTEPTLTHSISLESGNSVNMTGDLTRNIRYNSTSNVFRYYSSSQKAIQLYRYTEVVITAPCVVTFNGNGGYDPQGAPSYTQEITKNKPTALTDNTFTRENYFFTGWNTAANGTGTDYTDGQTVTLSGDLTLYAQWQALPSITLAEVQHGSITASASFAAPGTVITLTATADEGFVFTEWNVTYGDNLSIDVVNNQFTMPDDDVTVSASFEQAYLTYCYVKVNADLEDWEGNYLIVYENESVAFDGSRENGDLDDNSNTIPVSISNGIIFYNDLTYASSFDIAHVTDTSYSIQSASGYYVGPKDSGKEMLIVQENPRAHSLSIDANQNANIRAIITGVSNSHLRFNNSTGQKRFRYFTSAQQGIQLYRYQEALIPMPNMVTFNGNGGSCEDGTSYTQPIPDNTDTPLTANRFVQEGYYFTGWNTEANGTGSAYTDQQVVNLSADLGLYAQWEPMHTITLATVQNGSIAANVNYAMAGDLITLTATADEGYALSEWNVSYGNSQNVNVFNNQFLMPDADVTISAEFVKGTLIKQYVRVTEAPENWSGNYLIVHEEDSMAFNGSLTNLNSNPNSFAVTITDYVIEFNDNTSGRSFNIIQYENDSCTIQSASGYYIGAASSANGLASSKTTAYRNAISLDNDSANIVSSYNTRLRYNDINTNSLFRFYGTGQKAIRLYRYTETIVTNPEVTYDMDLAIGWNWISMPIEVDPETSLQQLQDKLGDNASIIKSISSFCTYDDGSWAGSLNSINNEETYMVKMTEGATISFTGAAVQAASHPITMKIGWNWIAYTLGETKTLTEALSGFTPHEGDIIKSRSGFCTFEDGEWKGSLNEIEPGTGLMYKSFSEENVILIWAE